MKYCSQCGHELRDGVKVCPNCGHKVDGLIQNRKGMSKKNKAIIIIVGILILAVIIAFVVIAQLLSPEKQVANISQAIEEENPTSLVENIDNDISKKDAEAFFAYLNESGGKDDVLEELERVQNVD